MIISVQRKKIKNMKNPSLLDEITIERFNVTGDEVRLSMLVTCYKAVFADLPWNEWKKCSKCGKKWGIRESRIPTTHCGYPIEEFWPHATVESDIRHEITEGSSCWVAVNRHSIVGFCWGYPIAPNQLERKLALSGLATTLHRDFGEIPLIAYQDELGVQSEYREKGLGKALYLARHNDFLSRGLKGAAVRTKRTPPTVTYSWFSRVGYKVVAEYRDTDDRVVLARTISDLQLK